MLRLLLTADSSGFPLPFVERVTVFHLLSGGPPFSLPQTEVLKAFGPLLIHGFADFLHSSVESPALLLSLLVKPLCGILQ